MAIQVEIDGIGTVELSDDFATLSPEDQNNAIEEIIEAYNSKDKVKKVSSGKKYDWISDVTGTVGSIIGGVGGAIGGGVFGGGIGAIPGAIGGGAAGGAAGGAFGEYIEGLLDPAGREAHDYASTAIQEGAFGLIPGVGGALTKGGLRVGSKVLSKIPIVGKFAADQSISKQFAKLSTKQKDKIITPLLDKFVKSIPRGAKVKAKYKQDLKDAMLKGYGLDIDRLFKKYGGKPQFEKAVNDFYNQLVARGVIVGGGVEAAGKGLLEGYKEDK